MIKAEKGNAVISGNDDLGSVEELREMKGRK